MIVDTWHSLQRGSIEISLNEVTHSQLGMLVESVVAED
jgi:hypothetical protein